jgi:hypothetical protein
LERLLKIILITQYRCKNEGEFPVGQQLKNYGHDLDKLHKEAGIKICEKNIHKEILNFLSGFAVSTRYYNIDFIAENKKISTDPMRQWKKIQDMMMENCKKKKTFLNKELLSRSIDEVAVVGFYDLSGNKIDSYLGVLEEAENIDLIQGYSVLYVYEIIVRIVKKIYNLEKERYMMPVLSEFFNYYSDYWSSYKIRNKKIWLNLI